MQDSKSLANSNEHEIDRLRNELFLQYEKRWDEVSTKLNALPQIQATLAEINARCIPCQQQLKNYDVILRGDPETGSLGLVQKVALVEKHDVALYGTPNAKGLVHKVETQSNKLSLVWKLTVGALGIAIVGLGKVVVNKIWP